MTIGWAGGRAGAASSPRVPRRLTRTTRSRTVEPRPWLASSTSNAWSRGFWRNRAWTVPLHVGVHDDAQAAQVREEEEHVPQVRPVEEQVERLPRQHGSKTGRRRAPVEPAPSTRPADRPSRENAYSTTSERRPVTVSARPPRPSGSRQTCVTPRSSRARNLRPLPSRLQVSWPTHPRSQTSRALRPRLPRATPRSLPRPGRRPPTARPG